MKLTPLVEAFLTAGGKAAVSRDGDLLHEFRIAAKRLRYTIEFLEPPGSSKWLELLRRVQDELGKMNDVRVTESYLRGLPSLSTKAKILATALDAEAEARIGKFHRTWRRRLGKRVQAAWLKWACDCDS